MEPKLEVVRVISFRQGNRLKVFVAVVYCKVLKVVSHSMLHVGKLHEGKLTSRRQKMKRFAIVVLILSTLSRPHTLWT